MFARTTVAAASLFCCLGARPAAGQVRDAARFYHLTRTIKVAGDGGWDYVTADATARRVYVAHGSRVVVLDMDNGVAVGEVPKTPGVHGIAVAPELGRGFTSNGADSSVTIFDLKTLATLMVVKTTGANPDAILFEPLSRRVLAFNGGSQNVTAIDSRSGAVLGTLALDGRPEFAQADGEGRVYVNLEDKNAVVSLDAASLAVDGRWPLAPCEEPGGMAIDRAHHRLFISCSNRMMAIFDTENHRVVTTVPIGEGPDATAFDPGAQLAFSSNGDGTLTIVQEDNPSSFRIVANVRTLPGARTMALDTKLHRIFMPTGSVVLMLDH